MFRVKDGLEHVVDWIDAFMGDQNEPRKIAVLNTYHDSLVTAKKTALGPLAEITPQIIEHVAEMDPSDFERFGYPIDPADMQTEKDTK